MPENRTVGAEGVVGQRGQLIVFAVAGELYALPVRLVREIVPIAKLSRPPGTPDLIAGFLVLDGRPIEVIRLAETLGKPPTPIGLYTPLVLVEVTGYPLAALLVEQVREIVTVDERDVVPLAADQTNGAPVQSFVRLGEERVQFLSAASLLERVHRGDAVLSSAGESTR